MFDLQDEAAITSLRADLSAAVAALDVDACLPSTAARLVQEGDQIERLGRAIKTLAAARVAATGAWKEGGASSPADWLATATDSTKREAGDTIDTGTKLHQLPATRAALQQGRLSAAKARAVTDAAAADPSAEPDLLAEAERGSLGEVRNAARRVKARADHDPEGTRRRIHAARVCRTWVDADGVGHLHASGPADAIARIAAGVQHRASAVFAGARAAGRREPLEAYAFDALAQLATDAGSGTPMPVGADAKIIVRIDHGALLRGHPVDAEVCEIDGVGPVPVSVVREWMDDAFVAAVLTEGEQVTRVVHLGRRFTARQKTALQWRDRECCVEGCTNTYRLELDHDTGWAETHTTTVDDADRICHADHQRKTAGWYLEAAGPHGKRRLLPPDHPEHPFQVAARRARGKEPPAAQAG